MEATVVDQFHPLIPRPIDDCDKGWMGMHLWGFYDTARDDIVCLSCGRKP